MQTLNTAQNSKNTMNKIQNHNRETPAVSRLPDDLEALFDKAEKLSDADFVHLEKAAKKLEKDPDFIADHAKGLIIEDILRAMENLGITASKLAERIGKSRQYVSKVLDEDRRVNFTVETLAEFSVALNLELTLRMVPETERMIFIRKLPTPLAIEPSAQFPDEESNIVIMPDANKFIARTTISFAQQETYEPSRLSA